MTKDQLEKYINHMADKFFGTSADEAARNRYKYGWALGIIDNCLLNMTPEQITDALGAVQRDAERMGVL